MTQRRTATAARRNDDRKAAVLPLAAAPSALPALGRAHRRNRALGIVLAAVAVLGFVIAITLTIMLRYEAHLLANL
jgi:hypothetical protein